MSTPLLVQPSTPPLALLGHSPAAADVIMVAANAPAYERCWSVMLAETGC
jgi:hypothetical protein